MTNGGENQLILTPVFIWTLIGDFDVLDARFVETNSQLDSEISSSFFTIFFALIL